MNPPVAPRALLPCVCGCEDDSPPPVEAAKKVHGVNGHPTKAKVVAAIDFGKVSRPTMARLLREARRLSRG